MRSAIFRQYDSRWGSLAYPTRSYSFANNGCGCCSCTHLIIERDEYKNFTPKNIRPFMVNQGFATKGHGTTWDGITKTLQRYGYDVIRPNISGSMQAAWKELNKGGRAGILLFRAGSRGGITWTTGGHYVAFLDYKVQNGKHYFYTKDSGGRHNDGWHCYETTMAGLLPQMWIVTLPFEKVVTKKGRYYTTGKSYTLQQNLNIRTGGGVKYRKKKRSEIPDNIRSNTLSGKTYAVLEKGVKVKCLQTGKTGKWIRTEYGWVCGRGASKIYIK